MLHSKKIETNRLDRFGQFDEAVIARLTSLAPARSVFSLQLRSFLLHMLLELVDGRLSKIYSSCDSSPYGKVVRASSEPFSAV
jgi:hypothetical protein